VVYTKADKGNSVVILDNEDFKSLSWVDNGDNVRGSTSRICQ